MKLCDIKQLVAREFSQRYGIDFDEMYSWVMDTIII